jgi:hypothetical protein
MTAAAQLTAVPQPLLPAIARFGIAAAVGVVLTVCWVLAESQSHQAVDLSSHALSPSVMHVKLPTVEILRNATR